MPKNIPSANIVLLFSNPKYKAQQDKINGIYEAAAKRNWLVLPVTSPIVPENIRHQMEIWKPIGCIIDPLSSESVVNPSDFGKTPVVFLGYDYDHNVPTFDCIVQNSRQVALTAAREILRLGLKSHAYVSYPTNARWNRERSLFFEKLVAECGRFATFKTKVSESQYEQIRFMSWLRKLEKPCGVLLATDHLAERFFAAANRANLRIPEDLAVVSVDNIEQICFAMRPHLSSVAIDYIGCGRLAIETIEKRISHPNDRPMTVRYQASGIVRRASTAVNYTSPRVTRALAFIQENACGQISVQNVADIMKCGRRQAEKDFRACTGQTILNAIQAVRLENAFSLLRNKSLAIEQIPSFCGYDSQAYFKMLFHRKTGMTMHQWRIENTYNSSRPSLDSRNLHCVHLRTL